MGAYVIKKRDIQLLLQPTLNYIVKFEILDNRDYVVDVIEGLFQGGSYNIDATSEIRRTTSMSVTPTRFGRLPVTIKPNGSIWLDKYVHMYIGLMDLRTKEYVYYSEGFYNYTDVSMHYDAQTNTIQVNLVDFMGVLDGSKNGQVGALTTTIPVISTEDEQGHKQYTIIREAMVAVIEQLSNLKKNNYFIDEMGESEGLEEFNKDYLQYREEHPYWNTVPYDLKFSTGCSKLDIIIQIRDLYPNQFETYFDPIDNSFCCKTIPSCINDACVLDNKTLQQILISEDTSLSFNPVKNVCEVWGATFEVNFFTENVECGDGASYKLTLDADSDYKEYSNGDIIGFHSPITNKADASININNLGNLEIYNSNLDQPIEAGVILPNETYIIKIVTLDSEKKVAYLLGNYQVHALTALVDGTVSKETYKCKNLPKLKDEVVPVYSKEYFMDKYNCENVQLTVIGGSPFTVQKIGEILDVKSGEEYSKIYSNDLALERAQTENWKNCRLADTITITTLLIPFLDVNVKVEYQSAALKASKPHEYIVKSIAHDLDNLTSQITMYRFYPLRLKDAISETIGTHKSLGTYKNGYLAEYEHQGLANVDENYNF